MFRPLVFLASIAAVLGEGVVLHSTYGDEDMQAESTIVREGYAYPGGEVGYGGYSFSARTPAYGGISKFSGPIAQAYYPQYVGGAGHGIGLEGLQYGGHGLGGGAGAGGYYYQPAPLPKFYGGGGIGYGGGGVGYGGAVGPVVFAGGEGVSQNAFDQGSKQFNNQQFENSHGNKGEEFQQGQQGFNKGLTAVKDVRGDSGYYSGEEGGKKLAEDAKQYYGGNHYNKEGENKAERKIKQGHRKGHVVKGFKKSHNKEESGRDEQYYDEEHDEGGNVFFNGQRGDFGESEGSSYKGNHQDGVFKANQGKQSGHYSSEKALDNSNGGGEEFAAKKYGGSGSSYGSSRGSDEQSLLGHQQSKLFRHQPKYVPIFSHF